MEMLAGGVTDHSQVTSSDGDARWRSHLTMARLPQAMEMLPGPLALFFRLFA